MSFTFADDFYKASCYYDKEDQRNFITAVCAYAFERIEPDESEPWYPVFVTIQDRIDKSSEQSARGKFGGRPKKETANRCKKAKPDEQDGTTCEANDESALENDTETALKADDQTALKPNDETALKPESETPLKPNDETAFKPYRGEVRGGKGSKGEESGGSRGAAPPKPPPLSPRFSEPSFEEVAAYGDAWASERGAPSGTFTVERFFDFYRSNGWKVGRNKMKDWQAAVRGWILRDHPELERKGGEVQDVFSLLD